MADGGGEGQVADRHGMLSEILSKIASIPSDSSMEHSMGRWGYMPVTER